jgi:hypothetical protein
MMTIDVEPLITILTHGGMKVRVEILNRLPTGGYTNDNKNRVELGQNPTPNKFPHA